MEQQPNNQVFPATREPLPHERDINRAVGLEAHRSPLRVLIIIVAGIAIAEIIAMIIVYFYRFLPYYQQVLLDAVVMVIIIFPLLYLLSTRPLLRQIQQRTQTERILQVRLRLIEYADTRRLDELLQFALDQIEYLTESKLGYFHFLEPDQKTLWLRAWSTNTVQNIGMLGRKDSHCDVAQVDIWADCVRTRQPVVHNDDESRPQRNALPEGHAPILREVAVPILRDGRIVAILGVGNKSQDYSTNDVEIISTLADFAWDTVRHKQASEALRASEEKFRTLVTWTHDWEMWLDPQGSIVYCSPACRRITGYGPDEFIHHPELHIGMIHPEDRPSFEDHMHSIHNASAGMEEIEYRILTRDGKECWMEHVCRPLFGAENQYLGRRVSNRNITERKLADQFIRERNQKEKLLLQTIHTMQLDIARDLHDTIGQNISFLRMKLDHLVETKIRKQADMQVEIQSMARAANESYDLLRGTLAVLQSDNSTDLFRLFTRYAEQIEDRASFKGSYSSQGEPKFISAKRMRQLFYIFREILSNIEKHANATEVSVRLAWGQNCLGLVISDNGGGFDPAKIQYGSHYGIKFMKERAELLNGLLAVRSAIGAGTEITLEVPYE